MIKRVFQVLTICIAMFFTVSIANAQDPVDKLIDKYDGKKGFNAAIVGKDTLSMALLVPNIPQEQKKMIQQMDEIVTIDYAGKNPSIESFYKEAIDLFEAAGPYTDTKEVSETQKKINTVGKAFCINENGITKKIITVFLFTDISGKEAKTQSVNVMVMNGNFDANSFKEAQKPKKKMF
ncbi:MAG: hypothetical protein LUE99_11620 [Bacteroides sp.]|nr:hypothetical protein [Bacteroides sp.]